MLLLMFGLLGMLLALSSPAHADPEVPRFEPGPCPIDVAHEMPDGPALECGTLVAAEDHENPGGRIVRLPVFILRSPNPNPAPDPLLFTQGGPGCTTVESVGTFARSSFVQERDVVLLEQRGNLYAQPSLDCDIGMWVDEQEGHTACLDSLRARGIDPQH